MKPKIEVITVGNELLTGQILNTNVRFICEKLYKEGYWVHSQRSILDYRKEIKKEIEESLKKFDIVICSGGLGPTQDDLTLPVAAEIFNSSFHTDSKLLSRLKKIYKDRLDLRYIEASAKVPQKASIFNNHIGTAPGFLFKKGKKWLILLPGVPYECEHLVEKELIPFLKTHFPVKKHEYQKTIHLCKVAESHIAPFIDDLLSKHKKVSLGIYPNMGILSVHFKTLASNQKEANSIISPYMQAVKKRYPKRFFNHNHHTIQEAIHSFLIKNKLSISFAESYSGGSLAKMFTQMPNASKYFYGSLCAYQNEVKKNILGVKKSTLEKKGAVSEKCVVEMAKGALKLFKTDLAIATSGIAGPSGGTKEKPVGTIFAAILSQDKILATLHFNFNGDRKTIINRSINYILAEFWMIRDNISLKR